MYGKKFSSSITTPEQIADWRDCWKTVLRGIDVQSIKIALDLCSSKHPWPPSTAEFLALCGRSVDYEGMFRLAANCLSTGIWTDKLTYWSAKSFGEYDLRTIGYQLAKTRWEKIVDQFAAEHTLPNIPEPRPALPAPGNITNDVVAGEEIAKAKVIVRGADRKWACEPKSQAAVDLMFNWPPMYNEIKVATENGYIEGKKWIPPEKMKK